MDTTLTIKKYKKGTPKPFAIPVTRSVASEKEAAEIVTASLDKKASAEKTESGEYTVKFRLWFDDLAGAKAFLAEMKEKAKVKAVKSDLTKMVSLMSSRGRKDLVKKTQETLAKL